jgi:PAS domain S-box-containing protein
VGRLKADQSGPGTAIKDADLRVVCDSVPSIVWTAAPQGASQYLNNLGTLYTGLSVIDGESWDWFSFAHPDDAKNARKEWKTSMRDSSPYSCRYRVRRFDGIYRWHEVNARTVDDAHGRRRSWIGTAIDVEDAVTNEAAAQLFARHARETSAILKMILEDAPVGIAFVDRDFRVRTINEQLASITLSTVSERTGQLVSEALPDLWTQIGPAFHRILEGGPAILNHEVTGPSRTDPQRTHQWRSNFYPVRVDNEIIGIGAVVDDVTTQLDMENQRLLLATIVEGSGEAIFDQTDMAS